MLEDGRAPSAAPQPGLCAGPVVGTGRLPPPLLPLPPIGAAGGGRREEGKGERETVEGKEEEDGREEGEVGGRERGGEIEGGREGGTRGKGERK